MHDSTAINLTVGELILLREIVKKEKKGDYEQYQKDHLETIGNKLEEQWGNLLDDWKEKSR